MFQFPLTDDFSVDSNAFCSVVISSSSSITTSCQFSNIDSCLVRSAGRWCERYLKFDVALPSNAHRFYHTTLIVLLLAPAQSCLTHAAYRDEPFLSLSATLTSASSQSLADKIGRQSLPNFGDKLVILRYFILDRREELVISLFRKPARDQSTVTIIFSRNHRLRKQQRFQ